MKLNRRVTIITRFSGIMFSLLLLGGLAACSDDNNGSDTPEPEPSTYPTTPFSKIELKEVIESDAQPVTATHTYLYNSAGRLTGYTGKQSFTAGDELFEIENTTTVEYKDHQAVITDEAGTVSTYTLEIPSLFITDMYPLSMHAVAIYGKILGEPANYLITQLIPDSNGESEETTTYTYTLDNRGIVTSCHAVVRHIRNGYEQDYTRTVNYTIE